LVLRRVPGLTRADDHDEGVDGAQVVQAEVGFLRLTPQDGDASVEVAKAEDECVASGQAVRLKLRLQPV
jgi:hypothetical protein